jgi:heat shock protein HslJ
MARALLLLAVLLLAGCAEAAGGGSPADDVVGEWELVSGTASGQPLPQPADVRATLTFEGGEAGGTSFCNRYSAAYTVDGDSVRFEGIGGTEMGCDPAVMAAETAYVTALAMVRTFALDGDDLVLSGEDVELRFRPIPPVPTSRLAGTDWVLESLIDGETASSVMGRSTLRLEDDGTFTATTACTTMTGRWQPTGDRVVFPEAATQSRECPPEAAAQEAHESAVLGSGFHISIEEDRLTALSDDDRGLVYRAEGAASQPDGEAPADDLSGAWTLRSGTFEDREIRIPGERRGTIEFDSGRVSGTSFCNGFGGAYRIDGELLVLEDVASTLVGCDGEIGTAEGAFVGVLYGSGLSFVVDGTELVLTSDTGELRFTRLPPVPAADLVGTRWVLEGIAQNGTASAVNGEPVLELREDGTATFTTGCPTLTGTWTTRGATVFLADLVHEPIPCAPDMSGQESLVTQVLSGGFQVVIDGDILTVTALDDRGAPGVALTYRAG